MFKTVLQVLFHITIVITILYIVKLLFLEYYMYMDIINKVNIKLAFSNRIKIMNEKYCTCDNSEGNK